MDVLSFLAAPFIASLILTGIHAYLGVHVVERGVIFVDLSLAQIAALGASVAIIYGADPHTATAYWVSLGFTFLGAFVFANVRAKHSRIPQEAIIGICYAVASAATILAMSKATGETEHLKDMLVGNLLFVSWHEVWKTAILYGAVGLFHYRFRKNFLAISMNHDMERVGGMSVRFWDLRNPGDALDEVHFQGRSRTVNVEVRQQRPRPPRVLAGHHINLAQYPKRTQSDVFEVSDRGRDDEKGSAHAVRAPACRRNSALGGGIGGGRRGPLRVATPSVPSLPR